MNRQRTLNLCSIILTAAACYVVLYCMEKLHRSGSSVGDDVLLIGYTATIGSFGLSLLLTYISREDGFFTRALAWAAAVVCTGSLSFWTWIHLSGVVVSYSIITKP